MYIQKAKIENIRSIVDFEIEFKEPAGWHVLIGDNGAGKSTIIRSIALALVGNESQGLRANWDDWINKNAISGISILQIIVEKELDEVNYTYVDNSIFNDILRRNEKLRINKNIQILAKKIAIRQNISKLDSFQEYKGIVRHSKSNTNQIASKAHLDFKDYSNWETEKGFFSVSYGPYRRFEGGSSRWNELFRNITYANLAAHLSVFGEDVALTQTLNWLIDLNYKSLEQDTESQYALENLRKLINSEDFLPHNAKLEKVSSEGVFFKDGNNVKISVNQMSDGYRSVLSMTFELIRQLVRVYGSELVFKNIEKGEMFIDLPGVVLVDEIDAHLHPTWQTRIGNWFLKYFPKLQFIVTTHSPLVCRAAEKGSIWRLAAPGSDDESGEVTGTDRERLIYGNILDAYGTEVFGNDVSISQNSVEKQEEMVKLSKKKMLDAISPEEEEKLENLKKVFTTDAPIEL